MKMRKNIILLSLVLIILLTPAVYAGSFGSNSLITIPTADTIKSGNLTLLYQRLGNGDLILGSCGLREGVELGGAMAWPNGLSGSNKSYPLVKVNLFKENNQKRPALSLGIADRNLYLVASKAIRPYGFRAHFGLGDVNIFADKVFLGVTKVLNPVTISTSDNQFNMPTTTIMAEYNSGFNMGAKVDFGAGISAKLATLEFKDLSFSLAFKNKF